jgi:hypothetical protein
MDWVDLALGEDTFGCCCRLFFARGLLRGAGFVFSVGSGFELVIDFSLDMKETMVAVGCDVTTMSVLRPSLIQGSTLKLIYNSQFRIAIKDVDSIIDFELSPFVQDASGYIRIRTRQCEILNSEQSRSREC